MINHFPKREWLCILVIFLATLPFLGPALFQREIFIAGDVGGSDFTDFVYTSRVFLSQKLNSLLLPSWASDIGFGYPLLAEGQIQTFYPTSLLYLILPPGTALNLSLLLTLLLLGSGVYAYGRFSHLKPLPALFAALAFTFSTSITMRWKHPAILSVISWFPLELLLVEAWIRQQRLGLTKRSFLRSTSLLGLLIGLQLLAGHPQTTLYSLTILAIYTLASATLNRLKSEERSTAIIDNLLVKYWLQGVLLLITSTFLGFLLASPQTLATIELSRLSNIEKLNYQQSMPFPFKLKHLITFLVPFSFGDPSLLAPYLKFNPRELVWELCIYPGIFAAFAFIIGGLSFKFKSRRDYLWLLMGVVAAVFGISNLLIFLPLYDHFRNSGRFMIFFQLFLALLSAAFLQNIAEEIKEKYPTIETPLKQIKVRIANIISIMFVLMVVGNFLDLWLNLRRYNQSLPEDSWVESNSTADFLKRSVSAENRYASLESTYVYNQIFGRQRGWRANPQAYLDYGKFMPLNSGLIYNLPGTEIYAGAFLRKPLIFNQYLHSAFISTDNPNELQVAPVAKPLLSLSGVKYFLSSKKITDPDFKLLKEIPFPDIKDQTSYEIINLRIYEYQKSLPKYFLAKRIEPTASLSETQRSVAFGSYQPQETLYSEEVKTTKNYTGEGELRLVNQNDGFYQWEFKSNQSQILFTSESYYPGWQAKIDDQNTSVIPTNFAFMSIEIPAGNHKVTLEYQPTYLPLAYYLSFAAAAFIGASFLLTKIK
ncbi:MAG: YfhO family protein [bacterium]|nr:YfhO family protein [bacterium]